MDFISLEQDPRLFLYTSLTSGSSHIITATSRLETILKANKIPFQAIDTATDEKARKLWQRRAGQRKLPGLVKEGYVIGDLEQIEEWNEFGELKENIGPVPANNAAPAGGQVGVNIAPPLSVEPTATHGTTNIPRGPVNKAPKAVLDPAKMVPLPGAEEMAARNKAASASTLGAIHAETMTSSPNDKKASIEQAKEASKSQPPTNDDSTQGQGTQSDATPDEQQTASTPADSGALEQPKSDDVANSSAAEAKESEGKNFVSEEETTARVAGLQVGDEEAEPQKQDAKDADAAGISNED